MENRAMHDMTASNLRSAFGGESQAHMRYRIWGDQAQAEGFPNVARLLRAVSFAELAHATGHFKALRDVAGGFSVTSEAAFGFGRTSENLVGAIAGEAFEINDMYPAYLAVAEMQGEKSAIRSMNFALSAEKIHHAMFTEAKQAVDSQTDYGVGPISVCSVCGHTLAGEAPDRCPICSAVKEKYTTFRPDEQS